MENLERPPREPWWFARLVWWRRELAVCAFAVLLLAIYARIFLPYLPTDRGTVGHDYGLFMPSLIAGYYWFLENRVWSVPWFSPAQCGGFPYFPDPNVGYYTVPQLLSFVVSPLRALQSTLLLFAMIGFAGFYVLMRRGFASSRPAASLSAGIFMFNGFFVYRILIGHLTFHAFMLLPAVVAAVVPTPGSDAVRVRTAVARTCFAALCLAYMFHAGMIHAIPPVLLAIASILLLHAAMFGGRWSPWISLGAAGIGALALSAGKLVAELSLLSDFPRDHYALPGIGGLGTAISLALRVLFFDAPDDAARAMVNSMWLLDRHEWEYGVSPVPLVFIVAGAVSGIAGAVRRGTWPRIEWGRSLALAGLAALLALPVVLNWFVPEWNQFLKRLPFFGSSSSLLRWFSAYIPVAVLPAGLVLDRLPTPASIRAVGRTGLAGAGVVAMLVAHGRTDRAYYYGQNYRIATTEAAWAVASKTRSAHPIERIVLGNSLEGNGPNDGLARGVSSIRCYQPLMGYRLEKFPVGSLRPGPVFPAEVDLVNLKNPACYIFPAENECQPGDHFLPERRADADAFARYRPFPFRQPLNQRLATALSLLAWLGSLAVMAFAGIAIIRARLKESCLKNAKGAEAGTPGLSPPGVTSPHHARAGKHRRGRSIA